MPDIIGYILKRQAKIEQRVAILLTLAAAYVAVSEIRNRKQRKEIASLRAELKELKHVKGD